MAHREWLVAGALVEADDGRLLLVRNQRRGGWSDWSTPGGVIDADDAQLLDGLTREVEEETGIRVRRWEGPLYEVEAVAPDLGWIMRCEVHRAVEFDGEVRVDDPDGIVVEAAFVPAGGVRRCSTSAPAGSPSRWGSGWPSGGDPGDAAATTTRCAARRAPSSKCTARPPPSVAGRVPARRRCRSSTSTSTRSTRRSSSSPIRRCGAGRSIVGGLGRRGVVAAASYEARRFGVHSAMPMGRARRACPDGVFLAPRFEAYGDASRIGDGDPAVVHAAGRAARARRGVPRRRRRPTPPRHGSRDRASRSARAASAPRPGWSRRSAWRPPSMWPSSPARWRSRTGCSSSSRAPSSTFLHPLAVGRLWGVGPATRMRLAQLGVRTVGDLAALSEDTLVHALGAAQGRHLHALAWNRDDRAVEPDRPAKSIGHEETFPRDITDRSELERELLRMAERVGGTAAASRDAPAAPSSSSCATTTSARSPGRARCPRRPTPAQRSPRSRARCSTPVDVGDGHPPARGRPRSSSKTRPRCRSSCRSTTTGVDRPDRHGRGRTLRRRCARALRRRRGRARAPLGAAERPRYPTRDDARDADVIRIGIVGCGYIGTVHSFALRQLRDAGLVDARVVGDLRRRRRSGAAALARHHDARACPSLDALLDDGRRRVGLHLDGRAPRGGRRRGRPRARAVFCEKPLAPTLAECEHIAAALEPPSRTRSGWCCGTRPVFRAVAEAVAAGRYGRPMATILRDDQYFPIQGMYASEWRADVARAGGGTLIEHSIHDVDVLRWILGDPDRGRRPHGVACSGTPGSTTSTTLTFSLRRRRAPRRS